jgi:cyclase
LLFSIIEKVAEECFTPFTVGGGIKNLHDIKTMLRIGADKVLINTAALENPSLISSAADTFGSQCIVVGIDVRREKNDWQIYTHGGQKISKFSLGEYLPNLKNRGAGEILVNSIDYDGMMSGYDLDLLRLIRSQTDCPIIALGGAGNFQHLAEVLSNELADAVACASLFHFGDNNPIRARAFLKNQGIAVKNI